MLRKIIFPFHQFYLKLKVRLLVKLGNRTRINRQSDFEGNNLIMQNTNFINSSIGLGSYIASNSVLRSTKIGRFCAIGDNVRTGLGLHPSNTFVSIHPAFFSTQKQAGFTFTGKNLFEEHRFTDSTKKYYVEIGNDVWIGSNVMIMDGTKIGDGAIIAGGSIVTKDVLPYSIVAGVPAKILKYRFTPEEISFLLEFKWWEKDINWLKENAELFTDIKLFMKKNKS